MTRTFSVFLFSASGNEAGAYAIMGAVLRALHPVGVCRIDWIKGRQGRPLSLDHQYSVPPVILGIEIVVHAARVRDITIGFIKRRVETDRLPAQYAELRSGFALPLTASVVAGSGAGAIATLWGRDVYR